MTNYMQKLASLKADLKRFLDFKSDETPNILKRITDIESDFTRRFFSSDKMIGLTAERFNELANGLTAEMNYNDSIEEVKQAAANLRRMAAALDQIVKNQTEIQ